MRLSFAIFYLTAVAYAQTPAVTAVQPSVVNAGAGVFTLTVNGSGFVTNSVVKWSGTALATTFVSESLVTATVPASLTVICGKSPITVNNSQTGASNSNLTVLVNPVLNALSPSQLPAGNNGFTVSALGQGFSSNVVLMLNASGGRTQLTTAYVSPTTLTAFIPGTALTGIYPVSLQVTDIATGGASGTLPITLLYASVTEISPEKVAAGGEDFTIFVLGLNFVGGTQALWNGTPLVTKVLSTFVLSATVPAALYADPAGAQVGISVKNPGAAATNSLTLIVLPNPNGSTITTLDPPTAVTGGPGFTLTVNGSRFTSSSTINWVTTPLVTTFVDSTKLTASIPASFIAVDGSAPITVTTPGVSNSNTKRLDIISPQPSITSLSPTSVLAGSAGFTLTVNGSGFVPASTVVGPPGAKTTYVSFTQLTASVPASAVVTPTTFNIQVSNPGSGFVSQVATFRVTAPTPVLSSLSPTTVTAGGPDFTLTANGSAFTASAGVLWNGTSLATTFVSATQLTAVVPAALTTTAGTVKVTVANEGPVNSNQLSFTIAGTASSVSIASLNPSSATAGGAAFTLTVGGAGFTANSKVQWNGTALATTLVSDSQVTARVPANLIAAVGTANVTVSGDGAESNGIAFTITAVLPTTSTAGIVNAASSAPAIAAGALISIYGENLASGNASAAAIPLTTSLGGTTVTMNGTAAPLLFVSPGQINAQVPYEVKAGTAKLIVQTGLGASAAVDFDVAATGPGVFTIPPTNHVVAQNLPDFTLNSATAPAFPGQFCTLYVTGQGEVKPPVTSGAAAPGNPLSFAVADVAVRIGGQGAEAQAAMAPGFVGLLQINVKIPAVAAGEQTVEVTIGGVKANATVISVGAK